MRRRPVVLFACMVLAVPLSPTPAMAIEEPAFELVRQLDGVEIRQYAPYVVAEVVVNTSAERAGNEAFPILAGYIFGKNKGERKMAMTAPVTQTAQPMKMEMTVPVTQTPTVGGHRVQFVLPRTVSLATAPEPLDARVQLREVPAAQVAVVRFSGLWSDANYQANLTKLKAALTAAKLIWEGEPVLSRYNAPITPWFMRRNEIWLNLVPAASSGSSAAGAPAPL